jgi:aconitase B
MDATLQQAIDQSQVTLTDADVTTLTTPEKKAVLDYLELSRLLQEKKIFTGQDDATKLKILQEVATKIIAFVNLLATKKDAVMQYSITTIRWG